MSERRALIEGLKPTPDIAARENDFVFLNKNKAEEPLKSTTAVVSRAPFSTRMRSDFLAALKRASLERQLNGLEPNTLQDILEQAVEPWLKSNGYLS